MEARVEAKEAAKWAAARKGVELVQAGQVVGLGTGTTAVKFLALLGERVRHGLAVRGVPTSEEIARQARELGIPLVEELPDFPWVDLTLDGADEVDPQGNLIKGGGGALLREKLVALASRREVILVDPDKLVPRLARPLPVELVACGVSSTLERLRAAGVNPELRRDGQGRPRLSDGGNYLADCAFGVADAERPHELHARLKALPGVVETGLFLGLAHTLLIGYPDGSCQERVIRPA